MNKRMNRKGFTLAEVLIVVAILVVLASVGTVALVSHMRNMAKLEMDGQAKEIFVAAQNHLSMADSQGYMGTSNFGADDKKADPVEGVFIFYYIVNGASSFSDDPTSVLNQMLPRASMDETARLSGSYIIRYQKDPAQVLDVFYVSKTGRYTLEDGFDDDDYDNFMDFLDGEELDLKNYGDENAVVGYYGGTEVRNLNKGAELLVPTVEIINGEQLIVKVTDHNGSTNGGTNMMTLVFIDIAGKELSIPLKKSATDNLGKANYARLTGNPVVSGDDTEFTLIIDDVTSQKLHFAYNNAAGDISDFAGKDFTIGEDITVYAVAYNNSVLTNIAQSVPQDFNSLFASRSGSTAKIGCFRHLLNLDATVSGVATNPVTTAEQIANLDWNSFTLGGITDSDGSSLTASGEFYPVTPAASTFTYDGKDLSIANLVVEVSTGEAGLFAEFSSGTIKDLVLKDFTVKNTGSGNAGALAGSFGGTLISGVLAYNTADATTLGVTSASGHAGGLVGKMTAGKVDKSAAAVYVSATAGNAGGLIGLADGAVTVSNSYSGGHTEDAKYRNLTTASPSTSFNVQSASGNAGGLIGAAAGASLSVGTSYSTASAKAEAENTGAGGLIGNTSATTVTINNSYATGLALTGDKATTGAFVALSTSTITGEGNKFLSSLNASPSNLDSLGYTLAAATSSDAAFCLPTTPTDTRASAVPYDTALITGFGGKYSFPTIDQLNGVTDSTASLKPGITDRHYGDWQFPTMEILNYTLTNSDTLFTDITFKENTRYVTMVLFGETSKAATAFLLQLSDSQSNATIVDTGVLSTDEREITWRGEPNEGVVQPGFNVDAEKKTLTITFDDITTAKGHFASIFPNLVPGENVTLFAAGGKCSWAELQTLRTKVYPDDMENPGEIIALSDNSLFATPNALEEALTKLTNVEDKYKASGEYVTELTKKMSDCPAEVKNPRHLQNLDTSVSNVNAIASELTDEEIEEGTKLVTAAKLVESIDWADKKWNGKESESDQDLGWKTKKIYQYNSTTSTDEAGQFNGIYNEALTEFDGDNKTIKGMIISNTFGQGAGNAGLFRYVDNALTIKNLRLSEIEVDGDSGNAGAFVGEKAGSGLLTLDTVLADAEFKEITGTNAGGLVGLSSTNLTINNSAASMLVTASGAAGGLVGKLEPVTAETEETGETEDTAVSATITNSYVGGHTTGGLYTWIDDSDGSLKGNWNIVSNNGPAGGLIGWLNEDASLKIEKAFNAATVKAKDGCAAGGLVGLVDGTTSGLVLVYVIAPVYDVKEIESYEYDEETGTYSPKYTMTGGTSGSLFGMTANDIETASDSVFFLPDVYNDPLPSEIELTEEDETIYKTNISYVGGEGAGGVSNVSLASYFVDEDSASSNLIGVDHVSLLEEMTSPFDPVLRGRYEYPFALWTSFSFESDSPIRYFYGDWQPILNDNTVRLHVHFRPKITKIVDGVSVEVDPSSSTVDELAARETNIAVQIPYRPIEILLPYPASISEFGYHINDWALYYGDQTSGNLIVYDEDGMPPSVSASLSTFTLSSQQFKYAQDKGKDSNGDVHITIVANYSEDSDKHYKLQLWDWDKDVNPLGSVYTEHGSYMVMPAKDEDKQDIDLMTMLESKHLPMLNMPGYRFRGWYTEKDGGGTRVYTTAYDAENKKFVMTYTGDETVTVSETGDLDLYAWYEKVPQQAVDLEFYLKVDDDVDPVYYNSYTFSFDAEKGLSSSLPYPGSNLTYLSKQWLDETEGATEPATITNDGTSQLLLLTVAPSGELHNDPPVIRYRIVFRGQADMDGYAVLYELEHTKKNEDGTYSSRDKISFPWGNLPA